MLFIKEAPVGNFEKITKDNHAKYKTVAMGRTHKEVLTSLMAAINADEIGDENYIELIEDDTVVVKSLQE